MVRLPAIATPRERVIDTYHGVQVVDEYRWLENEGSAATREWTAAQDARTRAHLEALPFREAIRRRCEEILTVESTSYDDLSLGGSTYFALKTQPPLQQPFLVALHGRRARPGRPERARRLGCHHDRLVLPLARRLPRRRLAL
jgi:prolyl oligopeptidase